MTRSLRKRHLRLWLVLLVGMVFLLAFARNNVPEFAGDHPAISSQP